MGLSAPGAGAVDTCASVRASSCRQGQEASPVWRSPMATTARARSGLMFWLLLAVTVYALTSAGVAIGTSDRCRGKRGTKTW